MSGFERLSAVTFEVFREPVTFNVASYQEGGATAIRVVVVEDWGTFCSFDCQHPRGPLEGRGVYCKELE